MNRRSWLAADELRIGLGCMRLSTDPEREEFVAGAVIRAALESGVTVFDTAQAYGWTDDERGHNERWVGNALRENGAVGRARVVTKGGMRRPQGKWVPDGRAAAIRADCEASLAALNGVPIDLFLLHAPDPRTPWATSVRALAGLVESGLVERVGLSNVNRLQLDAALELAPIAAVEVSLSLFDDAALRGGVVRRCLELGIAVIAHSPLGGTKRAARLGREPVLAAIAHKRGATAAEVALAALLDLDPLIVPIPGARRVETARSSAASARVVLDDVDRADLELRYRIKRWLRPVVAPIASTVKEVVLIAGIQGAGKTEAVAEWVSRGYTRLNRDERGGTLRGLAWALEEQLAAGLQLAVLDNTYATRASRAEVIETATRFGVPVRCVWMETPLAQAQINVVLRMLTHHGRLLDEVEMRRGHDQFSLSPQSLFRTARELEPPHLDEGFTSIDSVPFTRRGWPGQASARFISMDAAPNERLFASDPAQPFLVFGWRPHAKPDEMESLQTRWSEFHPRISVVHCPHPPGPPKCWCRPPLPGLLLAFIQAHRIDPTRSSVIGTSPSHRTLANALGAEYQESTELA